MRETLTRPRHGRLVNAPAPSDPAALSARRGRVDFVVGQTPHEPYGPMLSAYQAAHDPRASMAQCQRRALCLWPGVDRAKLARTRSRLAAGRLVARGTNESLDVILAMLGPRCEAPAQVRHAARLVVRSQRGSRRTE